MNGRGQEKHQKHVVYVEEELVIISSKIADGQDGHWCDEKDEDQLYHEDAEVLGVRIALDGNEIHQSVELDPVPDPKSKVEQSGKIKQSPQPSVKNDNLVK